jgi:hypothetical protein
MWDGEVFGHIRNLMTKTESVNEMTVNLHHLTWPGAPGCLRAMFVVIIVSLLYHVIGNQIWYRSQS